MNQIAQAEKLLKKIKDDTKVWESRLAIAKNQAENLEEKNRQHIDAIEKEGILKQQKMLRSAELRLETIHSETKKAEEVKSRLLDDVSKLSESKSKLDLDIDDLLEAKSNLSKELEEDSLRHQDALNQMLKITADIRDGEEKLNDIRNNIRHLSDVKQDIESNIELLVGESRKTEDKISELEIDYQDRKEYLNNDLYEIDIKLRKARVDLVEAETKDKQMRAAWAEKQLELEKRTEAVRRMEARVSDAEARIEELKRYDIL